MPNVTNNTTRYGKGEKENTNTNPSNIRELKKK